MQKRSGLSTAMVHGVTQVQAPRQSFHHPSESNTDTRLSFALESDKCTNNIAEYEAVILGLCKLRALGVTTCIIKTNSKVVTGQI
jgi:ribonuclease HI